jgi:hypothetical protein
MGVTPHAAVAYASPGMPSSPMLAISHGCVGVVVIRANVREMTGFHPRRRLSHGDDTRVLFMRRPLLTIARND